VPGPLTLDADSRASQRGDDESKKIDWQIHAAPVLQQERSRS